MTFKSTPPPPPPHTLAELKRQLTAAKDQLQVLAGDKAELEAQITQITQMSGDSSSQLGYLNQQLSEKSRYAD